MTSVQVQYWANKEQARHNAAMEAYNSRVLNETVRANRAREQISALQAQASVESAKASAQQALANVDNINQRTETEEQKTRSATVEADYAESTAWINQAATGAKAASGWGQLVGKAITLIDKIFD